MIARNDEIKNRIRGSQTYFPFFKKRKPNNKGHKKKGIEYIEGDEAIEYSEYARLVKAEDMLTRAEYATTPKTKARWLEKIGVYRVNVPRVPKPIDLDEAIKLGYRNIVHTRFMKKQGDLREIKRKSRAYLVSTGFFKGS